MASQEVRPPTIANRFANLVRVRAVSAAALTWTLIAVQIASTSAQSPPAAARRATPTAARNTPAVNARTATPRAAVAQKATAKKATSKQPQIVAVVNGQKITRTDLARECIRRFGKEVLQSEVNKHLILDECRKSKIRITNEDVEAEVARVAGQFSLPLDRWYAMLRDERGITPTQYKRDIVWPTLALRKLAAGQLTISQDDLQRAYDAEYGPKVQVRMISTSSRSKAQKLHADAMARPDQFDRLAKDNSEDENSAAARGLIPPIRMHGPNPTLEKTAFSLQEGQVSPVINVANQYVILKCERQIPAVQLSNEQRQHVLDKLKDQVRDEKLRSAASKMFKNLQAEAKVVNVYNDPALRKKMPGIAATVNNRKVSLAELGEQCILRHGSEVLRGEINRQLLTQALKRRSLQVTKPDLNAEVARAAESFGFIDEKGQPNVDSWLAEVTRDGKVTVDLYVRDAVWPSVALKKLVKAQVDVSEEDIRKGFAANYGERVEALAIVMTNQRTAYEAFKLARDNPTDKFFGELANQYSVEPVSRANFGQVPPIRRHGGQPLLEEEAFKLKPGELSGVLALGDKFVIIKCLGRTKPVVANVNAVRDELEKDIREKKIRLAMNREFDHLQQSAQIDNFLVGTSQSPTDVQKASHVETSKTGTPRREPTR